MFFNSPDENLEENPEETDYPNAVYARIDQIERHVLGGGFVLLDCINVDWVEEQEGDVPPIANPVEGAHAGIDKALFIFAIDLYGFELFAAGLDFRAWYCIEFGPIDQSPLIAEQHAALFSDPTERGVIKILRVDEETQRRLDRLANWGDAQVSNPRDIKQAINSYRHIDSVAIYDVGQGAATALLSRGTPQVYFDLGGSAIANWRSFPKHLRQFCFTENPSIILSHWDWDHWSSALRDRRAMGMTWVLPLQHETGALGLVHARFLALLKEHGAKIYWLAGYNILRHNQFDLIKASGPLNDRNESGLYLFVQDKAHNKTVLLPGDASIEHCYYPGNQHFDYLMVPHHGGKTGVDELPLSRRNRKDHVIYSYGAGNSYLHPRPDTVKAIRKGYPKNTHTALRNKTGFGHVGIDLSGNAQRYSNPRGLLGCQLQIQQWI